jgi:SAM-dependent methyltransferase
MIYPYTRSSNLFNLLSAHVKRGQLPPEVDVEFYKLIHEDLKNCTDDEVIAHFREIGKAEGAVASPAAHRSGFLKTLPEDADILEIGPFTKAAILGPRVKYFDVLDKTSLLERAERHGFPTDRVVAIDYVSSVGDLSIVPDNNFDCAFSSHCIEHQPDLIRHLQHVARLLRDEGRYYLIIPDKRFCFDHFLEASAPEKVIKAYDEKRTVHTATSVFEHYALTTHSDPIGHWSNWHADPNEGDFRNRATHALKLFEEARGGYVDVHAWQFTPDSFRTLITELKKRDLIQFDIERVYDTVWSQYEFMAVLKKASA